MKPSFIYQLLFAFTFMFSVSSYSRIQWVQIDKGTYQGSGFAQDRWTAISRCDDNTRNQFIALAQKCCESTETDTSAQYGNRCAGGYTGPSTNRSFDGGLAAYLCWPSGIEQQMATGFWLVKSAVRNYTCDELKDVPVPTTDMNTKVDTTVMPTPTNTINMNTKADPTMVVTAPSTTPDMNTKSEPTMTTYTNTMPAPTKLDTKLPMY